LVKISYWNLAHTIEYTTQQTKFLSHVVFVHTHRF
jgi:hypothetical protein